MDWVSLYLNIRPWRCERQ